MARCNPRYGTMGHQANCKCAEVYAIVGPRSSRANVTVRLMGFVVKLRWSREWEEYTVAIQFGETHSNVQSSYHTPDYQDARNTMAQEILRLRRQARAFDASR